MDKNITCTVMKTNKNLGHTWSVIYSGRALSKPQRFGVLNIDMLAQLKQQKLGGGSGVWNAERLIPFPGGLRANRATFILYLINNLATTCPRRDLR